MLAKTWNRKTMISFPRRGGLIEEERMVFLWRVALLLLLSSIPSIAGGKEANIGHGVICDKPEQAERFVTLRTEGRDTEVALRYVNDEAQNPRACGVAIVAFTPTESVLQKIIHGQVVSIVAITIVAVS